MCPLWGWSLRARESVDGDNLLGGSGGLVGPTTEYLHYSSESTMTMLFETTPYAADLNLLVDQ